MLYFGVFDGHRGALASEFMKERLHDHILFHLRSGEKDLETVLSRAFISANNAFAKYAAGMHYPRMERGQAFSVGILKNDLI